MKHLNSKSLILKSALGVGALALMIGNAHAIDTHTLRPGGGSEQKSEQKDDKNGQSQQKEDKDDRSQQKGRSTLRSKSFRPGQGEQKGQQKGKDYSTLNHHENDGKGQQKGYSKGDMMVRPGHGQQKGQQKG